MLNCKLSCRTSSVSALTVGIVQTQGSRKAAPSGGRKFVQTSAEDKLVWTMPSAAEFGETQEIIFDDFTGDKTMASVSLQSRLTLNCKLSRWAQNIGALTVEKKMATSSQSARPAFT